MDTISAFMMGEISRGRERMVFDCDKAARLIKERKPEEAHAGLSGDWEHTGGCIFLDGKPYTKSDTFLASTWATPELDIDYEIIPCYKMQSEVPGWDAYTKWPESALRIIEGRKGK